MVETTAEPWYKGSYRRCLVDMHIHDADEAYLSEFDPATYVALMKEARVQSVMMYANSHTGLCHWPVRNGRMHRGLRGRDIFGEVGALCERNGMDFIAYYSLVYNNEAYDNHPDWRIVDAEGRASRDKSARTLITGRYGLCCPNSGYAAYALAQIAELAEYRMDGVFFDMTFWTAVCYCRNCQARYRAETGRDMPAIVDWENAEWRGFQRMRERWIAEFAHKTAQAVKQRKPDTTVLHNGGPPTVFPWFFGAGLGVLDACDYMGADFYGSGVEQSFICKLFGNLSPNAPFEYYTSRCDPNLNDDHTASKTKAQLMLRNYLTMAHHGAFLFIDGIDPVGTLNPEVYRLMGELFAESSKYESALGGHLVADVALYYSFRSKYDPEETESSPAKLSMSLPHLEAIVAATDALREQHIPFTVICERQLAALGNYKVLVLPAIAEISEREAAAFEQFVAEGGKLYASGSRPLPALADLLGIDPVGGTGFNKTFVSPAGDGADWLANISVKYPLTVPGRQLLAQAREGREVLAHIALPYTDPADTACFASIHSDPPGPATEYPAIVAGQYGKGRVVWSAASWEAVKRSPHKQAFVGLVRELGGDAFAIRAEAPECVEILLRHDAAHNRYAVYLINELPVHPQIRITDIKITVRTAYRISRVSEMPDGNPVLFEQTGDEVGFTLADLAAFKLILLAYETESGEYGNGQRH